MSRDLDRELKLRLHAGLIYVCVEAPPSESEYKL